MPARSCFVLVLTLVGAGPVAADARLSPADARYLDSLLRDFLFDPIGAERVRVSGYADQSAGSTPATRDGWLVRGHNGRPDRVHGTDGSAGPARGKIERIDFRAQAEKFFTAVQPPGSDTGEWVQETAKAVYGDTDSFLALAAWYHRLGHDSFAAEALSVARAFSPDPEGELRRDLGRRAFLAVGWAFRAGDDAIALAACDHFRRVYPDSLERQLAEVAAIAADARRRLTASALGTGPALGRPADMSRWPADRRLAALIARLDRVGDDGEYYPCGREFHPDLTALIDFGEMAVPVLIDVLERDDRLTRQGLISDGIGCETPRLNPYGVRDLAEWALTEIFHLNQFPPAPGESGDLKPWVRTAGRVRHYWKTFGPLAPDERMMRLLTDPAVAPEIWREAAANLAGRRRPNDARWNRPRDGRRERARPRPAVLKYRNPTAAEAILAVLDRVWLEQARRPRFLGARFGIETDYLQSLVELGDHRIGPDLGRRAAVNQDPQLRREYAVAAAALGAGAAWQQFARDVERGTVSLESEESIVLSIRGQLSPEATELLDIAAALIRSGTPADDRALWAMTDPRHPYYPVLLGAAVQADRHPIWTQHPFGLVVLRREMNDLTPTAESYTLEDIAALGPKGTSVKVSGLAEWADRRQFFTHAEERACDEPARRLSELLIGAPFYHPLHHEADLRLTRLMDFFDTHRGRLRPATAQERAALGMRRDDHVCIPDLKPLGRPATAADVKAGLAVFHLAGKGRVWNGPRPTTVVLKADAKKERLSAGLVVQAEMDAGGKVVYGVIFRHAIRMVRADEVE